ncbi:hypothetical protein PHLCEN_2v11929 [Hermanssonia centrifuga]|uniref:Uncharacterized protein n=1 Tax=Hermanssonia centrifuga TaxID=98765 RepID=A0A2R6NIK8_9APHY|nr:hypothetical protein PHLCEN_2v11929 [Hermanssonia centrifuga]
MYKSQILSYPSDKMIFECAFDHLMQDIRQQKLMDISTWEPNGKRLMTLGIK